MNDAFKKKLAKRLRQTPDHLRCSLDLGLTNGCRCLGGIICDMAVEAGVIDPPAPENEPGPLKSLIYGRKSINTMPKRVMAWAGIDKETETWIYRENTYFQFSRIAERIEAGTFLQP